MRSFRLFIIACSFTFGVESILACTCLPNQSATQELKRATAVFSGKVIEVRKHRQSADPFATVEAVFEVERSWKGVDQKSISIFTSSRSISCGYGFKEGRSYLVYAHGDGKGLYTGLCSRTKRLKNARDDLKELDQAKGVTEDVSIGTSYSCYSTL